MFQADHKKPQLGQETLDSMKSPESLSLRRPQYSPVGVRRSFDMHMLRPVTDIFDRNYRSLSDSELNREHESSMTAEFMELPKRLTKRLSLHTGRSYDLNYGQRILESRDAESTTSRTSLPQSSVPKIGFTNIHVVVEDIDPERQDNMSTLYMDDPSYSCEEFESRNSGLWMNLEPQGHSLLSPRSSNGSICSYRSSNADSAIEILTPDEELPEHSPSESSDSRFWENRRSGIEPVSSSTFESVHLTGALTDLHSVPVTCVSNPISQCSIEERIPSQFSVSNSKSSPSLNPASSTSQTEITQSHDTSIYPADMYGSLHHDSPTVSPSMSSSPSGFLYKSTLEIIPSVNVKKIPIKTSSPAVVPETTVPSAVSPHYTGSSIFPGSDTVKQGSSLQINISSLSQGTSISMPPSVVVSDYSYRSRLEDKGSQTIDLTSGASSLFTYLSESASDVRRSLSNCSISSNESSTFSMPSDSSQDVEDVPLQVKSQVRLSLFTLFQTTKFWMRPN